LRFRFAFFFGLPFNGACFFGGVAIMLRMVASRRRAVSSALIDRPISYRP
jgi:hypothetical protein